MSLDGVEGIPVSLEDVLEVRNGPLAEDQVWAIMAKGIAPLQELSALAEKLQSADYGLIPSAVFILSNGGVRFTSLPAPFRLEAKSFLPAEATNQPEWIPHDYSKVFVFSFGAVLHYALTYQDQTSFSSAELFSLINMMMIGQEAARPTLSKVGQIAEKQLKSRRIDVNSLLRGMFESIMGTEDDMDEFLVSGSLKEQITESSTETGVGTDVTGTDKNSTNEVERNEERRKGGQLPVPQVVIQLGPPEPNKADVEGTDKPFGTPLMTSSIVTDDNSFNAQLHGDSSEIRRQKRSSGSVDQDYLSEEKRRLEVSSIQFSDELQRSQELDDSVFMAGQMSLPVLMFDDSWNLTEETSEPHAPKSGGEIVEVVDKMGPTSPHSFDDDFSDFRDKTSVWSADIPTGVSSSKSTRRTASVDGAQTLKPFDMAEFFESLSEDFTSYKDHGVFERTRPHCSLNCFLCSTNKRSTQVASSKNNRKSLPNLVFEPMNTPTTTPRRMLDIKSVRPASSVAQTIGLLKLDQLEDQSAFKGPTPLKASKRLSSFSLNTPEVTPRRSPRSTDKEIVPVVAAGDLSQLSHTADTSRDDSTQNHFGKRNFSLSRKQSVRLSQMSQKARLDDQEAKRPVAAADISPPKPKPRRSAAEKAELTQKRLSVASVTVAEAEQPVLQMRNRPEERFPPLPSSFVAVGPAVVSSVGDKTSSSMPSSTVRDLQTKMSGPEFLLKCRMPSIRLKALSSGKQRHTLFRHTHSSNVLVILLSGQKIDVSCNTMTTAGDVFDAVMTHTNLSETIFFGLTYLRDGEHFFLENEEKLYKFAPPGWKDPSQQSVGAKVTFTIYLRIKCYPPGLEFVRNELTIHQLYLQLRRDLIDARLKCSREDSCTLAALALQAEHGDRPQESSDYFQLEHYLPHRHLLDDPSERDRLKIVLCEIHSQYAGLSPVDAESEFLQMCKSLREYGIHFHRLFKSKPSPHSVPTPLGDPETGVPMWIGIMPRGVIILEERAGERLPMSQHPWHSTQTLQFDRKKFIVVPKTAGDSNNNAEPPKRLLFYADSCKKTSYFVHFAAAQHRFCMRMKAWVSNGTLENPAKRQSLPSHKRGSSVSSATDSGISREPSPSDTNTNGMIQFSTSGPGTSQTVRQPTTTNISARRPLDTPDRSVFAQAVIEPSVDTTFSRLDESEINGSLADRFESLPAAPVSPSDYDTLNVRLVKDSQMGLGLTLVDGEIQGIRGVYIKSLNAGGPAELNGRLRIGDRITTINGVSLENLSRHDAVELVRSSQKDAIQLEVIRLRSLYSSDESLAVPSGEPLTNGKSLTLPPNGNLFSTTSDSLGSTETKSKTLTSESFMSLSSDSPGMVVRPGGRQFSSDSPRTPLRNEFSPADTSLFGNDTFTPTRRPPSPAPTTTTSTPKHAAVSNIMFGGLAKISSASILNQPTVIEAQPPSLYGGLNHSSDEEEDHIDDDPYKGASSYHLHSDSDVETVAAELQSGKIPVPPLLSAEVNIHNGGAKPSRTGDVLDWTDDIDMEDINQIDMLDDSTEMDYVEAILYKNERGSLGIKIAGGKGQNKVYVKSLVDEPAISCSFIKPGDRILSVNDHKVEGMSHHDVVALLKSASSPVKLFLCRPKDLEEALLASKQHSRGSLFSSSVLEKTEKTLEVMLDKPATGSLGLSLARPTGINSEGIYIKHITTGSVVEADGRLKVGDRLWEIDGRSVAYASPAEVVDKLKEANGQVRIVVKRVMTSGLY